MPIRRVGDTMLPDARPVTETLTAEYFRIVGKKEGLR
jgi:hypothetical protein